MKIRNMLSLAAFWGASILADEPLWETNHELDLKLMKKVVEQKQVQEIEDMKREVFLLQKMIEACEAQKRRKGF